MANTEPLDATKSFTDLGVDADLADALTDVGISTPFPIQEITLPLALSGADVIGQARTGTGKTLAFGLPLLQRIEPVKRGLIRRKGTPVQALVIVPTRELCLQVRDDLAQAGARRGIEVLAVYGGRPIDPQIETLREGVPIVVGTPGRLLDLTNRGALNLSQVSALVLDEADEMLDLGFLPDVERLIELTEAKRQTLLFSATMPAPVVGLARRYMSKPTFLRADVEEVHVAPETRQYFLSCHRLDKPAVLARILQAPSRGLCVVFVRTKRMADILANDLRDRGIDASPIHSDLRQEARERALARFRAGKIDVLVATEVAARGLDIDDVTHVVNYDCPDDEKMYLHRIGRTGRAGAAGVAITLAMWNELARLEMIKRALEIDDETHEVFSTSDVLDDLFDLPERAAERSGPSRKDWQAAVARGERELRKSRPDRGEPDREPKRPAARDSGSGNRRERSTPVAKTDRGGGSRKPAADSEAASDGAPTRVRRRTRQRADDRSRAPKAPPATAKGDGQATPDDDATDETRTRVRRRTRSTQRGGAARPHDRATSGEGGRDRKEPARSDTARTGTASRSKSGGGGRGRSGQGKSRRGKSSSRGGSGRSGGRSGGSGRSAERTEQAKPSAVVDHEAARGDGRPRLRRPTQVTHLP